MLGRKPQYILRLRKWGFGKNIRQHEWDQAIAEVRQRETRGKDTQLIIEGKFISAKQLKKRIRRNDAKSRVAGPSHETRVAIIASTPPSCGSPTMTTRSATGARPASGTLPLALTVKMPFLRAWDSFGSLCKAWALIVWSFEQQLADRSGVQRLIPPHNLVLDSSHRESLCMDWQCSSHLAY